MKKLIALTTLLIAGHSFAGEKTHERTLQEKIFPKKEGCHLESFKHLTVDSEYVDFGGKPGDTRSKMIGVLWETSSPDCLKDYGVVQYIRGCVYDISYNPTDGSENKYFGHVRDSRGESIKFIHPVWEVDTVDIDPLYASYSEADANYVNRFDWNKYPKSNLQLSNTPASLKEWSKMFFHSDYRGYMMDAPVTQKRMMMTDLPSGSDYMPNGALGNDWISISSLEFKTCLYKTKDIPITGSPATFSESLDKGGPIVCFDWDDKARPNYKTKKIERTKTLDPYCLTQQAPE